MGSPITARRLTGGYANDVFRLDADGPPTVLHPQAPTGRRRQPELGAPAAGAAEQPAAGGARTGAGSRRLNLVLVSRSPRLADPVGAGPLCRPGRPLAVATVLGRLHASPVAPSTRPNHARLLQQPLPPLRRIPASLAPWRTVIAQARTDLNGLVTWLERERRPVTGLTHNDIFEGNVLVHRGRVSAVLDWEEPTSTGRCGIWPAACGRSARMATDSTRGRDRVLDRLPGRWRNGAIGRR